ncbi:efflux RND transporter periplasmic adaptor subunit [bacterium]|nr:efflux RND transporter periplasmic adaptor subunit [bacterium]
MRIIIITTVAVLSLSIYACGSSNAENGKDKKTEKETEVFVKVESVQLKDFAETIQLTGSIESRNDIIIPAEEGGRVLTWTIDKGGYVEKGQTLGRIDDAMLKAGYDAALANYNMAEVNYQKQKAAFEEQAISALQLKNLEYQRDAAKAQADMAKLRLDRTVITSPIGGILNDRFVDEGEIIGPGMPIAQVIDMNQMKVVVGVPERYSKELRVGLPVEFTVDSYPGETFAGTISFISAAVNPDNRSIPVEINFVNAQGKLKPQMIASIKLKLISSSKAILISQDYIQQVDMGKLVVYVMNNGVAEERTITLGGSDGATVRVMQGLKEGDQVITVGFQNLIDKQKIKIQE